METNTTTPAPTGITETGEPFYGFEVGQTYDTGRGDYIWTFTVVKRTARFITIESDQGKTSRVGVKVSSYGGRTYEWALPLGSYSMAPVINADRIVEVA